MAKNDERGNSLANQASYVRELVKSAEQILSFEQTWDRLAAEDFIITHIRIIHPGLADGEYRIVVKASAGSRKLVAFHNGQSLMDALRGVCNRLANGSLQFKDDKYV